MGDKTGIEWTEATWNPVVGCTHISPGCDHCYAAREASGRLRHIPVYAGLAVGGRFTGEVRCLPERLDQPLRWRKPRRIFVNSMSDLFHRDVDDAFIVRVFAAMSLAPQHTFQVLTKRPQWMRELLGRPTIRGRVERARYSFHEYASLFGADDWPLPHVWLGTSIESDRYTFRAGHLRGTVAGKRWLSIEPLIEPLPSLDLTGIDWVVVGGESGPGARPMNLDWARWIRDHCESAGVPFFMKQLGAVVARENGMSDRAGHLITEFPSDLAIREYPA
jgi:protein gp37